MQTRPTDNKLWVIGGEDVHMRIPLLEKLRAKGFEVGAAGSMEGEAFAARRIPYWRYPLERSLNPLADRRASRALLELFKQHRPGIIHAFDTKPALLAPLAAQAAGVPVRVRTITGMGYVFSSSSPLALSLRPVYRRLQRRASRATDTTIFQNHDDRDYFLSRRMTPPGRDAVVLGSGIDVDGMQSRRLDEAARQRLLRELRLEGPGAGGRPVVAMVSRLVRYKGVVEYLRAARMLRRRGISAQFLLVGPIASEGRQAVTPRQVEQYRDDVCYLGRRGDVPELLSVADVFVLPSYYREGVPRVLLEAGAMGLPLVTTDTPGCNEVVKHGQTGLLTPPRDATALAAAIEQLLDNAALRQSLGQAAQQRVIREFSLDRVADSYAEIYRRSLRRAA